MEVPKGFHYPNAGSADYDAEHVMERQSGYANAGPIGSFQDADLQELWIQTFAPGTKVRRTGPPDGPIHLLSEVTPFLGIGVRRLAAATNQHIPAYHLPQDVTAPALGEMLGQMSRQSPWDIVEFDLVPEGSRTHRCLKELGRLGWRTAIRVWQVSPVVRLDLTPEEYLKSRAKSFRRNLTTANNRAEATLGKLEFREVAGDPQWETWLSRALALEAAGWKGQAGTAIVQSRALETFYQSVLCRFQSRGQLRFYVLRRDTTLLAYAMVVVCGSSCVGWKTSYDPEFAFLSPGTLLQWRVIEALLNDPHLTHMDMMYAVTDWKRRWATGTENRLKVTIYGNTLRGRSLYLARELRGRLRQRKVVPEPATPCANNP